MEMVLSDTASTYRAVLRPERISTTGPLNLPFRIPEKYAPMDTIPAPR